MKRKGMKNPPYRAMTVEKWDSLGQTMSLKQAMDLWWNSIRVRTPNNIALCYKCYDGDYEIMAEFDDVNLESQITLDVEYDEDADGYPIVFATLVA